MTPKNIALADEALEAVRRRAAAEGRPEDEIASEAVLIGLNEARWQQLVTRGRNYNREMAEAATDEDAIQIAVDAVHEWRADQRNGR